MVHPHGLPSLRSCSAAPSNLFERHFVPRLRFHLRHPCRSPFKKIKPRFREAEFFNGTPARIRTVDPMIKSHLLYRLSYGCKKWYTRTDSNCGPND